MYSAASVGRKPDCSFTRKATRSVRKGNANSTKLIIFDCGRTLIEPGPPVTAIPNAKAALQTLRAKGYILKLGSLLSDGATADERIQQLHSFGIDHLFDELRFEAAASKFSLLDKLSRGYAPATIAVVDDRAAQERALHWGYLLGATTVWFRRGKFAHDLPAGKLRPDYIISSLEELDGIFPKRII